MNSIPGWARVLRILAIVLMGITTFFTLASGAGTVCVALAAERWESMMPLVPYKWLYLIFVLFTLAIGAMGIRSVVLLLRGQKGAFRFTITTLAIGILIGGIHMIVSRTLRGKSMPTDAVVYTTLLTLFVFLILQLPALRRNINFEKPEQGSSTNSIAAAITLASCGCLTLTLSFWCGPSHTFEIGGVNWANAWATWINTLGVLQCFASFIKVMMRKERWRKRRIKARQQLQEFFS